MTFDDAVDDLYGVAPSEFVARRTTLAAEAKADGDADLAKRIAALRKPTQVAWAINRWVRAEPDQVADLADLATELVAAQRRSSAAEIRTLSARRSALVDATSSSIVSVAADAGVTLSGNALREITQTLRAAAADSEVLEQLRGGRLETSAEYSGFGPASVFLVQSSPPETVGDTNPSDAGSTDADSADTTGDATDPDRAAADDAAAADDPAAAAAAAERLRAARETLEAAGEARDHAREVAEDAAQDLAAAHTEAADLVARRDELKAELGRVEDELRFARKQSESASAASAAAVDDLREAQAAFDAVAAFVEDLAERAGPISRRADQS